MKRKQEEPRRNIVATSSEGKEGDQRKASTIDGADVVTKNVKTRNGRGKNSAQLSSASSVEQSSVTTLTLEKDTDSASSKAAPLERAYPSKFAWPTREQLLAWSPFIAVLCLAAILRFWGLGDKPLHHDESLHAYFSLQLLHNTMQNWLSCVKNVPGYACYRYDPLLHGPFQFHMIATVYQVSQWLGAPDHGVNTTTVRIGAATLGTVMVGLPIFLRGYLGKFTAWLACFLLAISPSLLYFSRFAREDIYMACFTLLLVVSAGCYIQSRKPYWLILAAAGFALSYATKEATFLSIAVFGSFLALLIAWEVGVRWPVRAKTRPDVAWSKYVPKTAAPLLVLAFLLILAPLAKWFFGWMKDLSIYVNDPKNAEISKVFVQNLKDRTAQLFPWLGILLGVLVLGILTYETFGKQSLTGRRGIAKYINPTQQPLFDTIFTMPWTHWFFALVTGVSIFIVLFTALFTNIGGGIGDGIWQGLYYWLQQQQVARGGQPWYYYLLLIPLYEQIGLIFGIVGVVRCLLHPSRFRLFLVYWFLGNTFIYSWAGEKMPWLVIHMTVPMLLLAAVGLQPIAERLFTLLKDLLTAWFAPHIEGTSIAVRPSFLSQFATRPLPNALVLIGGGIALLLLALTLQNMYQVTYVHAADGPHEMMIYVQTSQDVHTVMHKIDLLDQEKFAGKHQMTIGVMAEAAWPFYWYLRDYTNVCYNYPDGCYSTNPAVILTAGDSLNTSQQQYSASADGKQPSYVFHQYHLRTWWDEGYKPQPCRITPTEICTNQPTGGGVGPLLWLSYGNAPPPDSTFNVGKAANNIWQWWWQRKAFGSTDGTTDMGLFIRRDLKVNP